MSLEVWLFEADFNLTFICKCAEVLNITTVAFTKAARLISPHITTALQKVAIFSNKLDFLLGLLMILCWDGGLIHHGLLRIVFDLERPLEKLC